MQKTMFLLIFFIPINIYSQQDVKIKAKGNGNKVEAVQEQRDTNAQKIDIGIEGDTNKIKVNQKSNSQQPLDSIDKVKKEEPNVLKKIIENTNGLVGLLISIPALILAWRGILFFNKKKKSKK
jgi:hypothetical protein